MRTGPARLDLILSSPGPFIETIENLLEDEAGTMLEVDLDESRESVAELTLRSMPGIYG